MSKILVFINLLFIFNLVKSQDIVRPKILKSKGEFVQGETNLSFPTKIDNFERIEIASFDKKKTNLGVTYEYKNDIGKTTLTIYSYPAGDGNEGRLRNEYLNSLQSIANISDKGIHATQNYIFYKKNGYKVNGYRAWLIKDNILDKSILELFECGKWFFKIRLTSDNLDSLAIISIEQHVLDIFSPTNLVKNAPLNSKANVYVAKAAFTDSIKLGSAMGSAFKKISWALENVDSLERLSGFPDLYLGLHVEALKEFLNFEKKWNFSKKPSTEDYLNQIKLVVNSGFINEFIMEQFSMIMIVPDDTKLDFQSYYIWKSQNPIKLNLNERLCVVGYSSK